MQVHITDTGATAELSIVDPASGLDWSGDCIGNAGPGSGIDYNSELERHECDQASYDWWDRYLTAQQACDFRVHALEIEFGMDRVAPIVQDAASAVNDIDDIPASVQGALDAEFGANAGRV